VEGSDIEPTPISFSLLEARRSAKENGVLLLVAPIEHKVRIEVGYGREHARPARFRVREPRGSRTARYLTVGTIERGRRSRA
jgi:hypothetical protein